MAKKKTGTIKAFVAIGDDERIYPGNIGFDRDGLWDRISQAYGYSHAKLQKLGWRVVPCTIVVQPKRGRA